MSKLGLFQKIKFFITSMIPKRNSEKLKVLETKMYDLHARVFSLERKLSNTQETIRDLSDLVSKISKVQYDLANSYNSMAGEIYGSYEKDLSPTQAGMILFGLDTDDDDDLIN